MLSRQRSDPGVITRNWPSRLFEFCADERILGCGRLINAQYSTADTVSTSHFSYRCRMRELAIPYRYSPRTMTGIANSAAFSTHPPLRRDHSCPVSLPILRIDRPEFFFDSRLMLADSLR